MSSKQETSLAETKTLIKSLLTSSPDVYTLNTLNSEFKNIIGHEIPFRKYGFCSLCDFLQSMTDILELRRSLDGRLFILRKNDNSKSEHIAFMVSKQKKRTDRYPRRSNYIQPINPIQLAHNMLLKQSEQFFQETNNCKENNFETENDNVEQFLTDDIDRLKKFNALAEEKKLCSICYDEQIGKLNLELQDKKSGESTSYSNCSTFDSDSDWGSNENISSVFNIQPNIEDISFKIEDAIFPDDYLSKQLHKIIITHIHNPHRFWFRFKTYDNLYYDNLIDELNKFCDRDSYKRWKFKKEYFKIGNICCVRYNEIWHRAKIVQKEKKGKAKLLLIDIGTIITVNRSEIRYFPKKFANIPVQAFRGSLEGIEPIDEFWNQESIKTFCRISCTDMIKANIKFVDESVSYILAFDSTKDADDKFFNEIFLNKQLARRSSDNNHFQNKFPTFEMIENSEYPSIFEIRDFINNNIPFNINEIKLLKEFMHLNTSDLKELFIHFKRQLMTETINLNENCYVIEKMKKQEGDLNKLRDNGCQNNKTKDDSVSEILREKIAKWVEEHNKKHGYFY